MRMPFRLNLTPQQKHRFSGKQRQITRDAARFHPQLRAGLTHNLAKWLPAALEILRNVRLDNVTIHDLDTPTAGRAQLSLVLRCLDENPYGVFFENWAVLRQNDPCTEQRRRLRKIVSGVEMKPVQCRM